MNLPLTASLSRLVSRPVNHNDENKQQVNYSQETRASPDPHLTHRPELGALGGEQRAGGVQLRDRAVPEHQHAVIVQHRVQTVGDRHDRAGGEKYFKNVQKIFEALVFSVHSPSLELCPDGLLDEVVGLEVDGGRGLVQHQDLGLPQQRAGEADQLPLPHAQVVPGLGNLVVQPRPQ